MNASTSHSVSVLQPVEPAIEKMKELLFRPFDFEKWILIGFCAWLAGLFGGGSNYALGNSYEEQEKPTLHHGLGELQNYILQNLSWLLPVVALVAILVIAFVILLLWLSSRGQFMFLHCVARNQAEVSVPWKKFRQETSSLWKFRMVLTLLSLANVVFFLTVLVWALLNFHQHKPHFGHTGIVLLSSVVAEFVGVCLVLSVISILTRHFVVPIMFLRGGTCSDAWKVLLGLLSAHWGRFTLYLLFQIVLCLAVVLVILTGTFCTCCIAGVLLLIPFVGTVLLLPITVFLRSYELYYLAQYGADFNVFDKLSD